MTVTTTTATKISHRLTWCSKEVKGLINICTGTHFPDVGHEVYKSVNERKKTRGCECSAAQRQQYVHIDKQSFGGTYQEYFFYVISTELICYTSEYDCCVHILHVQMKQVLESVHLVLV